MAENDRGFLRRWARLKAGAGQGKPAQEPPATRVQPAALASDAASQSSSEAGKPAPAPALADPADSANLDQGGQIETRPLSLEDVAQLTTASDFAPFMSRDVGPEVRNAAMKKLFADPHFNVMDGLDTYIDDYSRSEPIPEAMLRQMTSAKFLNLFDDEQTADEPGQLEHPAHPTGENADTAAPQTMAQSDVTGDTMQAQCADREALSPPDHAHTDLRLQPDDAPAAPGAGGRAQ